MHLPEPIVSREGGIDPEHEALLADSVGLALLVVLETLGPAERLAFVLHDMFAVPFDEIAPIVGRSPDRGTATREPRPPPGPGSGHGPDADLTRQRAVVDAFLAASRGGDFEALLAVLDPDVVLRADRAAVLRAHRARSAVRRPWPKRSRGVPGSRNRRSSTEPSGSCGLRADGRVSSSASRSAHGKIVEIDMLADPERLSQLDLTILQRRRSDPEPDRLGYATGQYRSRGESRLARTDTVA